MATLHCRHCAANIDSNARRTQCRSCGALFPFACAVCERNLRPPFSIYEDERHVTLDEANPMPLCDDHYLRKCPDCNKWFQADENPGFFRCASCAKIEQSRIEPEYEEEYTEEYEEASSPERETAHAPAVAQGGVDSNTLVLAGAGCAFLALMGWYLTHR